MYYQTLRTEGRPSAPTEERLVLFVASDAGEANWGSLQNLSIRPSAVYLHLRK